MKAIIFGINGQDGFYLDKILKCNGVEVIGVSRSDGNWIKGNVADFTFVNRIIKENKPEFIFHLAANSSISHSLVFENHETIATGTINILESVKQSSVNSKTFISGSGLQFKNSGIPINESSQFEARDPYSVARIHSAYAARYYRRFDLDIFIGYFFNHDSPQRSVKHLNQIIIQTLKRIVAGSNEKIKIGNLKAKKEFTFAGDAVEAVWKLINNKKGISECVVGSGMAYSIKDWLDICFSYYNLNWESFVELDTNYISEYDILVSDPSTLHKLGWKPLVDIQELAKMMIEHG